jgi:hypothetical protein
MVEFLYDLYSLQMNNYYTLTWIPYVHVLTRRVSLVEQILLTLPDHLSSPPVFSGVRVTRSLVLYVCFVVRLFVLLYLFFLTIVLSVFLRYTDSDYSFGIFKLRASYQILLFIQDVLWYYGAVVVIW